LRHEFDTWEMEDADFEEFDAVRDRMTEDFATWLDGQDLADVEPDVAGTCLQFKLDYLDGRLVHWTRADVAEVMLELFPRKVMADDEYFATVPPSMRAFVRYLDERGLLQGDASSLLDDTIIALVPDFEEALDDPANWGMGKRLMSSMGGLDVDDPATLDDMMERFNALPFEERDAILGGLPGPAPEPILLPPLEELEVDAERTVALERMRAFAAYVGDGRMLTQKGNLRLADGRELIDVLGTGDVMDPDYGSRTFKTTSTTELAGVDTTFRIAKHAGFAHVRSGKVVATKKRAGMLADEPLEAIHRTFLGLAELGPTSLWYEGTYFADPFWADEIDDGILGFLLTLTAFDEPIPLEDMIDDKWAELFDVYGLDHLDEGDPRSRAWESWFANDVRRLVDLLTDLGLVELTDEEVTTNEWGSAERSGGLVALTPLGAWLLARVVGRPVRHVGELRDADASRLLAEAGELDPEEAFAEIFAWIEARDPRDAAQEICAAMAGAETEILVMGYGALETFEPQDAEAAVRRLVDDAAASPLARIWLVTKGLEPPSLVTDVGSPEALIQVLGVLHDVGGPETLAAAVADLGPPAEQMAMIEPLWRVDLPATASVLDAIGSGHPDKAVAKVARKALFRHRTSRAGA
jgi:hypothetical protein